MTDESPGRTPAAPADAAARPTPKEIATLPPLPVLTNQLHISRRTGEPGRPAVVVVAMVDMFLAGAGIALTYALHWWAAAHPPTYPTSARLIEWIDPPPGKWLSLTLEGALALVVAVTAGISGAAGYNAWHGWRPSRWLALGALLLNGAVAALFSWWGLIGVALAAVGTALLWLPPAGAFFTQFDAHRARRAPGYRRPVEIFYGRLPRFR